MDRFGVHFGTAPTPIPYLVFLPFCMVIIIMCDGNYALLRIEYARVVKELSIVQSELKSVKQAIALALCEVKRGRTVTADSVEKWHFYHQHKTDAVLQMSTAWGVDPSVISWTCVKQYTDKMFEGKTFT
jgi:hypothetical protein